MNGSVSRRWLGPALIFLVALSIRLVYLAQDHSSPFFDHRGIDAVDYDQMARGFWKGTWPGHETFSRPPLYPWMLAIVYKLIGDSPGSIKLFQAMLGAISCALVFLIARRVYTDRAVAWLAAGICCAHGTLIYFDAQLLPASFETLLQLGLVLALLRAAERTDSALAWLPAGVLVALSVLNRGGTLIVLPLLLLWLILSRRPANDAAIAPQAPAQPRPSTAADSPVAAARAAPRSTSPRRSPLVMSAAALCAPTLFALALTATHNAAYDATHSARASGRGGSTLGNLRTGHFALVASNSGINFLLGNDPALRTLNDTNHPDHFILYDELLRDARRAAPDSVSSQDRYFSGRALHVMASEPAAFAGLLARKVLLLVNGVEIARNANVYAHRRYSSLLALLLWRRGIAFPTGVILPLAAVGLVASLTRWRRLIPLLAVLAVQALFILAFFVTDRYRVPILPICAILAAAGLRHLQLRWRDRRTGTGLAISLAILAAALIVCNLGIAPYYDHHGAYEYKYLADDREQRGDVEEAIAFAREGVRLQGDSAPARHALGTLLRKKAAATGNARAATEAIAQFREAARLRPDFGSAFGGLGLTYLAMGHLAEAAAATTRAVDLGPDVPVWRLNLGAIRTKQGRYDDAIACHRAALVIDPEFAPAYVAIGAIREFQGRMDDAVDAYRMALRYDPDNPETRARLLRVQRIGGP